MLHMEERSNYVIILKRYIWIRKSLIRTTLKRCCLLSSQEIPTIVSLHQKRLQNMIKTHSAICDNWQYSFATYVAVQLIIGLPDALTEQIEI